MLNTHEGTIVCKLDAQCTWRYHCLQSWCSMHMKVTFVCNLDAQCTSIMKVAFHFQAQCPMCMWAAEVLLLLMGCKGDSQECFVLLQFPSMFAAAICFRGWTEQVRRRRCTAVKGSQIFLSSYCCYNAIKLLTLKGKVSLLTKNMERVLGRRSWFATACSLDCGGQGYSQICLLCSCVQWTQRHTHTEEAVDKKRKQTWCVGFFL